MRRGLIIFIILLTLTGCSDYSKENGKESSTVVTPPDSSTLNPSTSSELTITTIPDPTAIPDSGISVDIDVNSKQGDIIVLGHYEQDNDLSNGKEPIEWIVLSNEGEKILLLSKYGLDCLPYNYKRENITWETCTLRKWLNEDFYNSAFSDEEKGKINTTYVEVPEFIDPDKQTAFYHYQNIIGENTNDKVFILSIYDIANQLYGFNSDLNEQDINRRCNPTAYAIEKGVVTSNLYNKDEISKHYTTKDGKYTCLWWIRSYTDGTHYTHAVGVDGKIVGSGLKYSSVREYLAGEVLIKNYAVRPAMWISLK